jgi:hypothetical protein
MRVSRDDVICHAAGLPEKNARKTHLEKIALQFSADIWYKVSRSKRVSYNGITPASQADHAGSIPATRSNFLISHVPAYSGEQ